MEFFLINSYNKSLFQEKRPKYLEHTHCNLINGSGLHSRVYQRLVLRSTVLFNLRNPSKLYTCVNFYIFLVMSYIIMKPAVNCF